MSQAELFPYRDRDPQGGGVDLMPDLPLVLRHRSLTATAVRLVDSGASISVLPYGLGVRLGFDWDAQPSRITLAGTLAQVEARGIVVEASIGQLPTVRLAMAWTRSDEVPFLLGQFNFFLTFEVNCYRARGLFEIRLPGQAPAVSGRP
jgi:hypothetical protein